MKRVDANQDEIVATIRKLGGLWIPTSGDPSIGFDGLLVWRKVIRPVEVKNGSLPPSRRRLTALEKERQLQLAGCGVPLIILESVEDVLKLMEKR